MTRDDYLWDRSGPPDPEVQALERALGSARWKGTPPARSPVRRPLLTAAAAVLFLVALGVSGAGLWKAWREGSAASDAGVASGGGTASDGSPIAADSRAGASGEDARPATTGYRVEALSGSLERTELRAGDRLQTDAATRARLTIGDIGSVLVEPDSRLRVEATGSAPVTRAAADGAVNAAEHGAATAEDAATGGAADSEPPHRLYLEQGALTASIFAAPRVFAVGTPSGLAVDMGCVYTARVEDDGSTRLSVSLGLVSFETDGRKVTVPAGASAQAHPGSGPGTPVWDDAPLAYRQAVEHLDHLLAASGVADLAGALNVVLATDRAEDSLTLWHVLAWGALPAAESERVLVALAALAPPPEGLDRAACLARDAATLHRWRESFDWNW